MQKQARSMLMLLFVTLITCLVPTRALAHGGHASPIQTFTQAIGPYEIAVTLELPVSTPAPLYLDVAPPSDIGTATLSFRVAPRGQSFAHAPVVRISTNPEQQDLYFTQVDVDRPGDWDLEMQVDGARGRGVALIPFTIIIPPLPGYTIGLMAAVGGLALALLISILVSATFQRRQQRAPGWVNYLLGQGMIVCMVVAAIFGVQQVTTDMQSAQAAAALGIPGATMPTPGVVNGGRPHVNLTFHTLPALPAAGQPLTLTFDLSDGSTGLPVEDLTPHHDALMHLIVSGADDAFFAHVHPARVAPGRFAIAITPDRPGRYTAYVEIQRQDSGIQVITRDFTVGGAAPASAAPQPLGLGIRALAGMQVTVTSTTPTILVGKQAILTFSFARGDVPVTDLRPWLGMAGHLIVKSADGNIFGHVHAVEPMAPASPILAANVRYGPNIQFVFTFPQPGRYQLWAQFKHDGHIVTVPVILQVGA